MKTCAICGSFFNPRPRTQQTCSRECLGHLLSELNLRRFADPRARAHQSEVIRDVWRERSPEERARLGSLVRERWARRRGGAHAGG